MIEQVVERLHQRFPEVPEGTLHEIVGAVRSQFDGAPIRDFIPLFVERQSKGKLASLAGAGLNSN